MFLVLGQGLGLEPATFRSEVQPANHYTTANDLIITIMTSLIVTPVTVINLASLTLTLLALIA